MKQNDIIYFELENPNKYNKIIVEMEEIKEHIYGYCYYCSFNCAIVNCPRTKDTNEAICDLPENKKLVFKDITDLL